MGSRIGLGIDVGGTNTDAVLIDLEERKILSFAKAPTTRDDFARGIHDVLYRLDRVHFPKIALISLSTTLATNSIVEGVRRRVCGILIGYEPGDYRSDLTDELFLIPGGHTVLGEEKEALDEDRVKTVLEKTKDQTEAYAVCGYFSVRNPDHELRVKRLVQEVTRKPVVCGHEISLKLDAVKRATTTILNAHLIPILHQLIESVKRVFGEENIQAPLMIVKGDGSLMSEAVTRNRPIETILSGPAASVIGARYLLEHSGEVQNAVVVDIGGTTTDIALLKDGFPRLHPQGAKVGGWQTNVMAIDIRTIALGGDSQMTFDEEGRLRLGPRRIIPLSYLGYCYPSIREELRRLYEDRRLLPPRTNAELWIRVGRKIEDGLDELGEGILKEVTGNPLSLFQLTKRTGRSMSEVMRGVSTLERRGLVQRSGLTPTDLLHLTGIFQAWDKEAADWGARLLYDRWKIELPTVVEQLEGAMNRMIGLQILDLLLSESIDATPGLDSCKFCNLFVDEAFGRTGRVTGVQFGIHVKEKLIGIGAPAYAFLPSVAEKLETHVVVPFYSGVANAIGAITSAIVIQEELFIKPYQTGYRPFSSAGMGFHHDLGEATEEGRRLLRKVTLEKAREAGAEQPEVFIDEKETWTTARGGETVFIEKILTARAAGNPRMVLGGSPSELKQNSF